MTKLDEKRAEWLYAHFQAISRTSERLLVLFGLLFVCALAEWRSDAAIIEFPFIKVGVGRELLLGCTLLSAAFTAVAFFGNYDMGEHALIALSKALGCEYEELWFVDTNPTIIDFAKFRRRQSAAKRGVVSGLSAALLYPLVFLGALTWMSVLLPYEAFMRTMTPMEILPFVLAVPTMYVAWDRAIEYTRRRWRTFVASRASAKGIAGAAP
jgi:hypothetical protein